MKKTEHEIQNEIRLLLGRRPDIRIFRANVGQAWTGERIERRADGSVIIRGARPFSTGLPAGWPDLFGFRAVTVTPELIGAALPVFAAIEVKALGGRLRPEQEQILATLRSMGALCGVARSYEEAAAILGIAP